MIKALLGYMLAGVQFLIIAFVSKQLSPVEQEITDFIMLIVTFGLLWLIGEIKERK